MTKDTVIMNLPNTRSAMGIREIEQEISRLSALENDIGRKEIAIFREKLMVRKEMKGLQKERGLLLEKLRELRTRWPVMREKLRNLRKKRLMVHKELRGLRRKRRDIIAARKRPRIIISIATRRDQVRQIRELRAAGKKWREIGEVFGYKNHSECIRILKLHDHPEMREAYSL